MKKLLYLFIVLGFFASACQKDETVRPFVNIAAQFENVPDYTAGVWQIPYSEGNFEVPKAYKVYGSCDYMDGIDPEHSVLTTSDIVWDPELHRFFGVAKVTLSAISGDKLYMEGEYFIYLTYYNESFFHFTGGTGIFDESEGWMKSTGQGNDINGNIILTAAGKIYEPKSK